jgi:hypothetical protein
MPRQSLAPPRQSFGRLRQSTTSTLAPPTRDSVIPPVPARVRDPSGWDWDVTSVFSLPRISVPAFTPRETREAARDDAAAARSMHASIWSDDSNPPPRISSYGTLPPPPKIMLDGALPSPKGSFKERLQSLHPLLQNPVKRFQTASSSGSGGV